ncbi:MAG: prenyltransferase [Candidatus Thermoplasmatota archaeon]|nr:prenyltransferase [Candidatus Thermoplasmatota archaeon]
MPLGEDIKDMLIMGRLHFLLGGFLLFSLGALIADAMGGPGGLPRFLMGYAVFFPAHLSVSYSNDLYDVKADSYNTPSPFSGGSGVLNRRPELRRWAFILSVTLIMISLVMSLIFMIIFDMGVLFPLYVLMGALLGWFYTAPPLKLSYRGMGEISTALTIGLLVPMMGYWIMMGKLDPGPLPFAPSLLLYGCTFILNVQVPDVEADLLGGKRSLVTRVGREKALDLVFILSLMASVHLWGLYLMGLGPVGMDMLPFALASLVPVIASMPSLVSRARNRRRATYMVTANLGSNFIFLGSIDLGLLLLQ